MTMPRLENLTDCPGCAEPLRAGDLYCGACGVAVPAGPPEDAGSASRARRTAEPAAEPASVAEREQAEPRRAERDGGAAEGAAAAAGGARASGPDRADVAGAAEVEAPTSPPADGPDAVTSRATGVADASRTPPGPGDDRAGIPRTGEDAAAGDASDLTVPGDTPTGDTDAPGASGAARGTATPGAERTAPRESSDPPPTPAPRAAGDDRGDAPVSDPPPAPAPGGAADGGDGGDGADAADDGAADAGDGGTGGGAPRRSRTGVRLTKDRDYPTLELLGRSRKRSAAAPPEEVVRTPTVPDLPLPPELRSDAPPPSPAADAAPTAEAPSPTSPRQPDPRTVPLRAASPPAPPPCPACEAGSGGGDGRCPHRGPELRVPRDHMEQELPGVGAASDRGLRHDRNDDSFAVATTTLADGSPAVVAVVCDGVSSSVRPDVASATAATAAQESLLVSLPRGTHPQQAMREAVAAAAQAVTDLAGEEERHPWQNAPACTLVSAVLAGGTLTVGWVGDSRAYWLPEDPQGVPLRLTQDDSWAAQMVAAGLLTEEAAYADPRAHAITGWLGADAQEVIPHTVDYTPESPGVMVICTDGLWNYAESAEEMAAVLPADARSRPLATALHLVGHALEGGGHDNVTVAVIPFPPSVG